MYQADFRKVLKDADQKSSSEELYKKMQTLMSISNHKVTLEAHLTSWVDHVMEATIRKALGDNRREHHPDAILDETPIEIKHSSTLHAQFPNDSVGVRKTDDKWYIFTEGKIDLEKAKTYGIWMMRADHLYDGLDSLANKQQSMGLTPSKTIQTSVLTKDVAIAEIENEINIIAGELAAAIYNKSTGVSRTEAPEKVHMSLRRGVNVNSVRFDIKYGSLSEKLVRDLISEILKD